MSSTVIKIHSTHGNIRHNRNKWKQKAYRYLLPITNYLGILIHSKNIRNIRGKHPVAMTIQTGNEIIEYNVNVIMSD